MKIIPLSKQSEWLTPNKEYLVIGVDDEYFRVIDDKDEPILFPKCYFRVIDSSLPDDWVWQKFEQGEYYGDPPELATRGFYEDFFDGKPEAVQIFQQFMKKIGHCSNRQG